jgi:hypothetical protein
MLISIRDQGCQKRASLHQKVHKARKGDAKLKLNSKKIEKYRFKSQKGCEALRKTEIRNYKP